MEVKEVLAELNRRTQTNRIAFYLPYGHPDHPLADRVKSPWQLDFHNGGAQYTERLLMAGNRTGKTFSGAAEMSYHLTGEYPDWWEGRRFDKAVNAWACSITNETSRDIQQKELLGEPHGTGAIPGDKIVKVTWRQAGVSSVADKVTVKHKSGGVSHLTFKTYDQGWRKYQGTSQDVIWMDEEPDNMRVYSESLLRIMDCNGIIYTTFTPLLGETDLVRSFQSTEGSKMMYSASWDDAPHLGEKEKATILSSVPEFEREARQKGIPMLGTGRIYPVKEESIMCEPFEIPNHFWRICGTDFGVDHPAASVWIAIDRDSDVIYVYDCYKASRQDVTYHAQAIKSRGEWIPVSWPHDGLKEEIGTGVQIKDQYKKHGVRMLSKHASYKDDRGNKREPSIMEILERMRTGRLRVFNHLSDWMQEFRSYHRDDRGQVVKKNDDLMDATRYAVMMSRYAQQNIHSVDKQIYSRPIVS